jgi:hypothetical protein
MLVAVAAPRDSSRRAGVPAFLGAPTVPSYRPLTPQSGYDAMAILSPLYEFKLADELWSQPTAHFVFDAVRRAKGCAKTGVVLSRLGGEAPAPNCAILRRSHRAAFDQFRDAEQPTSPIPSTNPQPGPRPSA